jgi:16S rRNA (cytosine967-C5)-methyltransferase
VTAFLNEHPDFALRSVADLWPETVGGASPTAGETLQLTPAAHETDGFFVAVLERSAAASKAAA